MRPSRPVSLRQYGPHEEEEKTDDSCTERMTREDQSIIIMLLQRFQQLPKEQTFRPQQPFRRCQYPRMDLILDHLSFDGERRQLNLHNGRFEIGSNIRKRLRSPNDAQHLAVDIIPNEIILRRIRINIDVVRIGVQIILLNRDVQNSIFDPGEMTEDRMM